MKVVSVIQFIPLDEEARMTRFCIQCNRIIGEKCVQCGTEATANSNGHAVAGVDFDCPSCGHHFLQGDGGDTGGMCEPCFDAELRKAHEQAAKLGDGKIVTLQTTRSISVNSEPSFKDSFVKTQFFVKRGIHEK
ncbi:MAG: hypothetical protein WB621_16180 [Candidatus Acidiferrales bacterium]